MKKLLLLITLCSVIGCTITQAPSVLTSRSSTPINTEQTREIGESVTEFVTGHYVEALKITKGSSPKTASSFKEVEAGEIYYPGNKMNNIQYYFLNPGATTGTIWGVSINEKTGAQKYRIGNYYEMISYEFKEPISYTKFETVDKFRPFFKREFMYNGKSGNTIKFSYREFSNDIARPSFTQEVQYDLAESNVVGFKGMRLEILSATNTNIRYKILNDFTK